MKILLPCPSLSSLIKPDRVRLKSNTIIFLIQTMEDFVNIIGVRHSRIKDVLYEYYVLELWPAMIKSRAKTFFFFLYVGFSCRNLVQMDYIEKNS